MSIQYPDLSFTSFPNSLDNISLKSNITNANDSALVAQIQTAILAGDFVTASNIMNANPQLNGKIFSANDYNQLRDAILALQRFYSDDITPYITTKQTEWQNIIDRFSFKGIYSPTLQYYQNNMVNYTDVNGTFLYLCTSQPPIGTLPTNTAFWRVITMQGQRGESGSGMSFTYLWNPSMNYSTNDVVIYGDKWWGALQPNIFQVPMDGSLYWQSILVALPAIQIPVTSSQPSNQVIGDQWYKVR